MFSRKYRFHGHKALNYVYRQGKTLRHTALTLKYIKNDRQTNFRVAVVVSKKVTASAVKRNKIRRRIYSATLNWQNSNNLSAYDLVFSAFQEQLATMPFGELQEIVDKLLNQLSNNESLTAVNATQRGIVDPKAEQ